MKKFIIICFIIIALDNLSITDAQGRDLYSARYDSLDIDTILGSDRLVTNYVDCLLNRKPCPPEGKDLKRILPEALRTKCGRCSPRQKENALKVIRKLYEVYPTYYSALQARWDQTGEYHRRFEEYLRNEQFNDINNDRPNQSNVQRIPPVIITTTTPRPTTTRPTTTTVRPTPLPPLPLRPISPNIQQNTINSQPPQQVPVFNVQRTTTPQPQPPQTSTPIIPLSGQTQRPTRSPVVQNTNGAGQNSVVSQQQRPNFQQQQPSFQQQQPTFQQQQPTFQQQQPTFQQQQPTFQQQQPTFEQQPSVFQQQQPMFSQPQNTFQQQQNTFQQQQPTVQQQQESNFQQFDANQPMPQPTQQQPTMVTAPQEIVLGQRFGGDDDPADFLAVNMNVPQNQPDTSFQTNQVPVPQQETIFQPIITQTPLTIQTQQQQQQTQVRRTIATNPPQINLIPQQQQTLTFSPTTISTNRPISTFVTPIATAPVTRPILPIDQFFIPPSRPASRPFADIISSIGNKITSTAEFIAGMFRNTVKVIVGPVQ